MSVGQGGLIYIRGTPPNSLRTKYMRRIYPTVLAAAFLITALAMPSSSRAQTCSCAGAAQFGSFESPALDHGVLRLGMSYSTTDIGTLVDVSDELDASGLSRESWSLMAEMGYGFLPGWSLDIVMSAYAGHSRSNPPLPGAGFGQTLSTSGGGDTAVMLKYAMFKENLFQPFHLSLGAGFKAPLGESEEANNGITLAEDLQPGTGAWDGLFMAYGSVRANRPGTLKVDLATSLKRNGENDRDYRLGDIYSAALGLNYLGPLNVRGAFRYRRTGEDKRGPWEIPNTGGSWLLFEPGLSIALPYEINVLLTASLPLYRKLTGTQLTTRYSWSLTVFHLCGENEGLRSIFSR